MANESTYTLISSLLPDIWERVLRFAEHNFVMPSLVTTFTDMRGMVPRNITEYGETGMGTGLGEIEELPTYALERDLLATLTPAEIGKQYVITDRRMETDDAAVMADAIRQLGYAAGRQPEEDLLAQFKNLGLSELGSRSAAFSLDHAFEARAIMDARAIMGSRYLVVHPFQYLDVAKSYMTVSNTPEDVLRRQVASSYYIRNVGGVQMIVSSLVPRFHDNLEWEVATTGSPTGGTFDVTIAQSDVGEPGIGASKTITVAYNASATDMQTAIRALERSNTVTDGLVGVSAVTVTKASTTWTIAFTEDTRAAITITVDGSALTGGTSPTATATRSAAGQIYARGAFFDKSAIAMDWRRGVRIEPDRDPSKRLTELNLSAIYAKGTWRANYGIPVVSDATAPNES